MTEYCMWVDITACQKVSEFKNTDILLEEILANCDRVEFNDRLVDIKLEICLRDFCQFANFANIPVLLT
jgi:hypothetical protein